MFELIPKNNSKQEQSKSDSHVETESAQDLPAFKISINSIVSWSRLYGFEIFIAVIGTLILLIPSLTLALQFDRNLVGQHHYWLLMTSQFTHFNWTHWGLDYLAIIIAALHTPIGWNKKGTLQVVISLLIVGIGIWWMGDSTYYRGISGVVYGWLLLAVLRAKNVDITYFEFNLIKYTLIMRFKAASFNIVYKVVFIGLILLKVMSDVLGWDLFGVADQIGAKVSWAAHLFGLISVIFILPFHWQEIKENNWFKAKM